VSVTAPIVNDSPVANSGTPSQCALWFSGAQIFLFAILIVIIGCSLNLVGNATCIMCRRQFLGLMMNPTFSHCLFKCSYEGVCLACLLVHHVFA